MRRYVQITHLPFLHLKKKETLYSGKTVYNLTSLHISLKKELLCEGEICALFSDLSLSAS